MQNSDTGRWWLLPSLIALSGALALSGSRQARRWRTGMRSWFRPVLRFFSSPASPPAQPALLERIRALEHRLALQQEQIRQLSSQLRSLHAFRERFPNLDVGLAPADIIGRDASALRRTLIVDAGRRQGVSLDCPVVSAAALVGRVVDVSMRSSVVRRIDDPASVVPVVVMRTRDQGILRGALGAEIRLEIDYVGRLSRLRAGDLVLTSGMGGVFPKGLVVGAVAQAANPPGAMFKRVRVRPAVDLNRLERVLILTRPKPFRRQSNG